MAGVKVRASIEAKWDDQEIKMSVSTTGELAALAVRLLVEEVGTDAARQLIRDELGVYRTDYKGAGIDQRTAKKEG
ncbi:hypothetical protein NTD84_03290 [Pseudomonas sp. 14P_8.1_Bac3]|uniref:hypothetical protein n=1 Tax=Pseudomonas sp. 14P_8.1_Bac3 TaxID=2971621 RepID=UPI0021C9DBD8|nr:hypothetical protein [Pseudomonas sp. 14P_8.1_Bac3]MCU1758745.1 hypothetical protein [Pseudomonas sp. 14P_8.1_Bac3]